VPTRRAASSLHPLSLPHALPIFLFGLSRLGHGTSFPVEHGAFLDALPLFSLSVKLLLRTVATTRRHAIQEPLYMTSATDKSSSRTTRSARAPASIRPASGRPNACDGTEEADGTASGTLTPSPSTALRTAWGSTMVLDAIAPVSTRRASPPLTRTRRSPRVYSPSPSPVAAIASVTRATRSAPAA